MLVFSDVQSLCISARLWLQVGSPKRLRSDLNQTVSFPPTLFSSSTLRVYFEYPGTYMYCLTPNLSHVFQELLSVDLIVLGNLEFVLTMLGLCCSLEVARTSGLQSPMIGRASCRERVEN